MMAEEQQLEPMQVLVQNGITLVPPAFVQPLHHRPSLPSPSLAHHLIPTIDVLPLFHGRAHPAYAHTLSELAHACQTWGFFQVVNHEVDERLLESVKQVTRGFFELPWEAKRKWSMKPGGHVGYAGRFSTSDAKVSDWVDLVTHYLAPETLRNPDIDRIPTEPSTFRETTAAYGDAVKKLILHLCNAVSESLGLPPDYIEEICGDYTAFLRINCYPTCPQPDQVLGVSSHSDGGILTVLLEDGGNGLEVKKDGQWVPVRTLPKALVVNVGDMLQVISNGKYQSVDHRAVVNHSVERYSIVVFFCPQLDSSDVVIAPAKQLLSSTKPARYRGTSFMDYHNYFFERDKAFGKSRVDSLLIRDDAGNL